MRANFRPLPPRTSVPVPAARGLRAPFVDRHGGPLPGSLSEKTHVRVNGIRQGMVIKGRDETNPVLLFVHGGPGMPEYFLTHSYPTDLENDFTVVWWDQRGAGLSYNPRIPAKTMTVEQLSPTRSA